MKCNAAMEGGEHDADLVLLNAAWEIERLRNENEKYRLTIKFYQAKMDDLHDERTAQVSKLHAELAEARKPDCRFCYFRYPIKNECSLVKETDNPCVGGSRYKPDRAAALAPVRLYEKEGQSGS